MAASTMTSVARVLLSQPAHPCLRGLANAVSFVRMCRPLSPPSPLYVAMCENMRCRALMFNATSGAPLICSADPMLGNKELLGWRRARSHTHTLYYCEVWAGTTGIITGGLLQNQSTSSQVNDGVKNVCTMHLHTHTHRVTAGKLQVCHDTNH